jgi:hypothetical protein
MEATYYSQTSVEFQWTTQQYVPKDRTLRNHRCENIRSYMNWIYLAQDWEQFWAFVNMAMKLWVL